MSVHPLFRADVDKDLLWQTYLGSFPPGTNPVFRTRTEFDCSCCRQFIRSVGNVVAVVEGERVSIWDIEVADPTFQTVASAMKAFVLAAPIANRFLNTEPRAGTDRNYEDTDAGVRTWEHFFINIPNALVCRGVDAGPRLSEAQALHDVLLRSLTELKMDAVDTTLELIGQNSLYRGEEHKHAVKTFREVKVAFDTLPTERRDAFVWSQSCALPPAVSKIRNTSIGQLLTDLSEGREMEVAVRAFEAMVAPANYKRPTALVTKAMVEKAKATVAELGLTSALERRYAHLADISVNNVMFADRSARKAMADNPFDDLAIAPTKARAFDRVEEIGIDTFIMEVLPRAETVELLVENRHAGNFVSLIAPADPTSASLFKWDNRFSWSYAGDVADSIKERVKRAGGNVTGDLCCRLAWFNYDDLDLHMDEPDRNRVYFGNRGPSRLGGQLDVDMNAMGAHTREPVENIFYRSAMTMRDGEYVLSVNQYSKREAKDVGFEVEIDWKGDVKRYIYAPAVRQGETIVVARMHYTKAKGIEIIESLPSTSASRKVWGIDTEQFHRVNVAMLSPNHWDGHGIGNRHFFFMLDGCQNDGTARGFYNEFLKSELDPHRKVLELVGAKMRAEETVNQLSGLGFSSTQRNYVVARVKGAFTRTVKVVF